MNSDIYNHPNRYCELLQLILIIFLFFYLKTFSFLNEHCDTHLILQIQINHNIILFFQLMNMLI
jgi:hypothetical protein